MQGIEKLKNETATWERLTWKQNLQEVFGTQAGCTWLLPVMPSHLTPGPKMHQNKFQVYGKNLCRHNDNRT